jgi:hypothetical protein
MGDAVLSGEYSTRAAGGGLKPPTVRNVVKPPTGVEQNNEDRESRRWKKHSRAPPKAQS